MTTEIIVPSPGESITQVQVSRWLAGDGDTVEKDQEIVEVDSDKATFPLVSPVDGILKILVQEGETVAVGTVVATIDAGAPVTKRKLQAPEAKQAEPLKQAAPVQPVQEEKKISATPLAGKIMEEQGIRADELASFFGTKRITRKDLDRFLVQRSGKSAPHTFSRISERKKITMLRQKLSERLVSVKNQTAMLTTFNEVDMSALIEIKSNFQESFRAKYGIGLGFMSFFTKAVTLAMNEFPQVNSMIDGDELVTPEYIDVGIAVSAPKGLMVPVVRNAESLSVAEIEAKIRELAQRARENRITIEEMQGGTFTITNGGVFGSLLSTPILNPPQSAILGMHNIVDRPVAIHGEVKIRPMMYVALSYDHRVIDGRESVGFLVKVKQYLEQPALMLTRGEDPLNLLLDL